MHDPQEIRKSIQGIQGDTPFSEMLRTTGERMEFTLKAALEIKEGCSSKRIREINEKCQAPLIDDAYENSLCNPAKAVEMFGEETGLFVSAFCHEVFNSFSSAFSGRKGALGVTVNRWLRVSGVAQDDLVKTMKELYSTVDRQVYLDRYAANFHSEASPWTGIAMEASGDDLSYLYRYGERITENNIKNAEFIFSMPEDELAVLADTMVDAYIEGFREDSKDLSRKSTVGLILQAGYERIFPMLKNRFEKHGLKPYIMGIEGTKLNRQMDYDHRFDYALGITDEKVDLQLEAIESAYEELKEQMSAFSGVCFLEVFGEKPFSPVPKPQACRAGEKESALYNRLMQSSMITRNRYIPREETSFEIIAFPSPEIEGDFREIFRDTVRVNTLSNKVYRPVQQAIIDALDGAERARVKGSGTNETDLTVSLCPLANPKEETAFINCLASVNVPLGEVFTSPKLKGTTGLLHVEESFLNGLRYDNIRLTFQDGYLADWSCENFDDPQKGKDYIHENLIFPHKTLPLGEFAIGTNTLVYEMALKHRIMGLLPILILEKMGPHFAIGDTCFSWEEDSQKPDPCTGKTMVAVDNEHTESRREDPSKAYTNKHTDVTLPYSSLDTITAIHHDGTGIDIIRGGRFVLPGTELLNEAIEKAHSYL